MFARRLAFGLALIALGGAAAGAAPTPVPGGANQVSAISAKLGQTIFNGNLRVTITALRNATDAEIADYRPNPDQKLMAISAVLRNGTTQEFTDLMQYTLADKDDISVDVGSNNLHPGNLHILQGAAARQTALFPVDKAFVPVKLIVGCATCNSHSGFRTIRFTIASPPH